MNKYAFKNGLKLIYEHRQGLITSFCIGFNGGALEETNFKLGTAHAVEHLVFKGTKNRTENEINEECDNIFGFQNAMTNYPYVIYYGTSLSTDFVKGLELYSDIVLNPIFPKKGFNEEISIIKEELKEWKDDIYQYCEDELLYNSFNKRRIKDLIIGNESSIASITLEDIKAFYNRYYTPHNAVISVVSSLSFNEVVNIVETYFDSWSKTSLPIEKEIYEENNAGIFVKEISRNNGAKIQYCFPIDNLNITELKALSIFNALFGNGVSSLLYDEIRTKNGLSYEVSSSIKKERGIKLFTISLGTSKENIDTCIDLINKLITRVKGTNEFFTPNQINKVSKNLSLKKELFLEKSIQLAKELTTYELMFGDAKILYDEVQGLDKITKEEIMQVINKILKEPSIQIVL